MKCYIYLNSFSLINTVLSFGMGLRLVKLFSCFKLWNGCLSARCCVVFQIFGYLGPFGCICIP
jgi:hypothetical protein